MHSSQVLDKEILAVEVVWSGIPIVALIASPKVKAKVLCVDMALPFVLRAE